MATILREKKKIPFATLYVRLSQLWLELIFFTEVCMVLCFGLVMKIILTAHWYFSCCRAVLTELWPFQLLKMTCQWGAKGHKMLIRDIARTANTLTKEIFHTMWCYAQQWKMEWQGGWHLVLSSQAPITYESPDFALLARAAFAAAVFISSHDFLTFSPFQVSLLSHCEGQWASSCVELSCY